MKKLISLFAVLAVVFSLAGCEITNNASNMTEEPGNTSQNTDITAPEVEETDPVIEQTQGEVTEPEKDDGSVRIDPEMQLRLNLFLSSFAEAQITQYPCCDYHKIQFVLEHCRINGIGEVEYTDDQVRLGESTVDSILNTYTGAAIAAENGQNQYHDCTGSGAVVTYRDNSYYCPAEQSESVVYIAVADRMTENEDGTYLVSYHVYEFDSDFDSYDFSGIYQYTTDEAIYDWNLATRYEAEAVIRDYFRSDGKASYQLISLKTVE